MKYHELMLVLAVLLGGNATTPRASFAQAETEPHHHHVMAPAGTGSGYQRSVKSYKIPDIKLVDMNGTESSLRDGLNGNDPIMLNFIFTSCNAICPVMSTTFHNVQEALGGKERNKVRMVSISIDPENDTPARLKEYAEKFHAGPQWRMLTGSIENSIAAQRAFGVFRGDKMSHTPVTFLRAKGANSPWVRLDGLASAPDIIKEYRKLASG